MHHQELEDAEDMTEANISRRDFASIRIFVLIL